MDNKLFAPTGYYGLTPKEKKEICNGAGPKGKGWIIPDTMWGLSIKEAANIHDYMYHVGKTIEDKESADRSFLNNMLRVIDNKKGFFHSVLRHLRHARAKEYYNAVKYFGGPAFWSGKN